MLLVILFVVKLIARLNTFHLITKKHGQDTTKQVKQLENLKTKAAKIQCDIDFIKTCKKENLLPTFCRVKTSIRNGSSKLILLERILSLHFTRFYCLFTYLYYMYNCAISVFIFFNLFTCIKNILL